MLYKIASSAAFVSLLSTLSVFANRSWVREDFIKDGHNR